MSARNTNATTNPIAAADPWQDDPEFPAADWIDEVFAGDTRRGYLDWVAAKQEEQLQESPPSETARTFVIERQLMVRRVIHSRIAIQAETAQEALALAKEAAEEDAGEWDRVFEEMAEPGCDEFRIVDELKGQSHETEC